MDIEKVAAETPEKIITNKIDIKNELQMKIENIITIFNLMKIKKEAIN